MCVTVYVMCVLHMCYSVFYVFVKCILQCVLQFVYVCVLQSVSLCYSVLMCVRVCYSLSHTPPHILPILGGTQNIHCINCCEDLDGWF